MMEGKCILDSDRIALTIKRLALRVFEDIHDIEQSCFLGIQPRGITLSDRLIQAMRPLAPDHKLNYGKIDITFYRDDFRLHEKPLAPSATDIPFDVEGKVVYLIDDVLYTGRTIHAAISALQDLGRPQAVKLIVLVDRRFNRHFPIKADYSGIAVDAIDQAYVSVQLLPEFSKDQILMFPQKLKRSDG